MITLLRIVLAPVRLFAYVLALGLVLGAVVLLAHGHEPGQANGPVYALVALLFAGLLAQS